MRIIAWLCGIADYTCVMLSGYLLCYGIVVAHWKWWVLVLVILALAFVGSFFKAIETDLRDWWP